MGIPAAEGRRDQGGRLRVPWRLLVPDLWVPGGDAIDLASLLACGIRCLLVDVDNTLAPWGQARLDVQAWQFVRRARESGLRVVILSNASPARRAWVAKLLGVPVAPRGFKPWPGSFVRAAALVGCRPHETAAVGDQLWTDVLGAKLAGMRAILVDPLDEREHALTRLGRRVERWLLRRMVRSGWVPAERLSARLARRSRA